MAVTMQLEELYILGVRFHKLTAEQLLTRIVQCASVEKKTIVANVNVHALNLAYKLSWYRRFLNEAHLVFCDGFGVALGSWLLGYSIQAEHRMTCPDWIEELARTCAQHSLSLFLLAGRPGVADKAAQKLRTIAPGLRVATHHGFFAKSGPENDEVVARINQFQPQVLYVGMGMPLQEQWIIGNLANIDARVFLPLGACLDFYTRAIQRAPIWMTDYGLEWMGRLIIEPRRLWRRYLIGNPLFLWRVLKQRVGLLDH